MRAICTLALIVAGCGSDLQRDAGSVGDAASTADLSRADSALGGADLTGAPADLLAAPADLQAAPADLQAAPADLHAAPADLQSAPADLHAAPADLHAAPADLYVAPDLYTAPPDLHVPPPDLATGADMSKPPSDMATVCGNGVCESGESSMSCPKDCVLSCGDVVVDLSQWLMWQAGSLTDYNTWQGGGTYCQQLVLDGYDNWGMPSYQDFEGVLGNCTSDVRYPYYQCPTCAQSPACTALFPGNEGEYWDTDTYGTCCASAVDFYDGELWFSLYTSNFELTRCNRALTDCASQPCLPSETCLQLPGYQSTSYYKCVPSSCQ